MSCWYNCKDFRITCFFKTPMDGFFQKFKQTFSRTPMDAFDQMNIKSQRNKYLQQNGSDAIFEHKKKEHK